MKSNHWLASLLIVSFLFVFGAGPNDGTAIDNIASILGSNATSQVAQATTIERSHTELDVTLSTAVDPVAAGGQQTLTVTWTNTGNQDTTDAVMAAGFLRTRSAA